MAKERTLAMIKPDAIRQGQKVITEITNIYLTKTDLRLVRTEYFQMDSEKFFQFYGSLSGKKYFWKLQLFYCFQMFIALEFEGENAVEKIRKLNGATNPAEALPGTIRKLYGIGVNDPTNAVHGSESAARALEEIAIIWPE